MLNKKRQFSRWFVVGSWWLLVILLVVIGLSLFEVFAATTTITDVSSAASTLLNVTAENNFTHLTIGNSSIGFINDTNLVLYMPFDTNNNSAGKTYDYSVNGNDGTVNGGNKQKVYIQL